MEETSFPNTSKYTSPPQIPKSTISKVTLVSLFTLILVSTIAIAAYQLSMKQTKPVSTTPTPIPTPQFTPTPTLDETANWKTYTNTILGFSFKYPASYFKYMKESEDVGISLAPYEGEGEAKGSPLALTTDDVWIDASVSSGANLTSLDEYISIMKQQSSELYDNIKKQPVQIGSKSGYKITGDQPYGPQGTVRYEGIVLKDQNIYNLVLYAYEKDVLFNFEKMFDQILSTFRFLDQNQPVCPFVYSIPAKVKLQYMTGSSLYMQYKDISLDINSQSGTLQLVTHNGNQAEYRLTASQGETTLKDILTYLCGLKPLSTATDHPVHSPTWQMTIELTGSGPWTIISAGTFSINGQPYTDTDVTNIEDPSQLLGNLVQKQIR